MTKLLWLLTLAFTAASTSAADVCSDGATGASSPEGGIVSQEAAQPVVIDGIFDAATVDWLRAQIYETLSAGQQARGHLEVSGDVLNKLLEAYPGAKESSTMTSPSELLHKVPCALMAGPQREHHDKSLEEENDVSLLVYTEDDASSTKATRRGRKWQLSRSKPGGP